MLSCSTVVTVTHQSSLPILATLSKTYRSVWISLMVLANGYGLQQRRVLGGRHGGACRTTLASSYLTHRPHAKVIVSRLDREMGTSNPDNQRQCSKELGRIGLRLTATFPNESRDLGRTPEDARKRQVFLTSPHLLK